MRVSISLLVIIGAYLCLQTSAKSIIESKCSSQCDAPAELFKIVDTFVTIAFSECYTGNCDYCKVAAQIKASLQATYNNTNWVVLLGADQLLTKPEKFASQHNRKEGTYILYRYDDKHDVEVFRPKCQQPVGSTLEDFHPKFNGITRALTSYKTDMPLYRWIGVYSEVNKAFDKSIGDFEKATSSIYSYLKRACPGEWAVLVASRGKLDNPQHFCAAYDRYSETSFSAIYDNSHGVQIFSPKC